MDDVGTTRREAASGPHAGSRGVSVEPVETLHFFDWNVSKSLTSSR
ncbi:Uncharacterised protein [Mycobacteroides abscessus subsp. abscessus]|nr:hypothetical protein [Mycobacteroides abscessus]SHQ15605.1 Uncharacterised protein [Mycobacteroides abscessus subsp. abscessus]MBE5510236.1 hypothetical protein [Mycobacteroides abscessus]QOF31054.1 hypothetical protein E3G43_004621 [Mycobacteroides abscessus]QOF45623.1 hypothetical protein E3G69_004681 [Mycobacteroides abscessus]